MTAAQDRGGSIDRQECPKGRAAAVAVNRPAKQAEAGGTQINRSPSGIPAAAHARSMWSPQPCLDAWYRMEDRLNHRRPLPFPILQIV